MSLMEDSPDLSTLSGLPPESFAHAVFNRYAERLLGVANDRLGARLRAKVGPEDIVQSAFKSFFRRHREFHFDDDGSDGMWGLLVVITVRKCAKWADWFAAEKRSAGREVALAADQSSGMGWLELAGRGPSPEEGAMLSELVERLMSQFNTRQQEMLLLRMQGHELNEIAQRVQSSRRTVARVVSEAKGWLRDHLQAASERGD
jgi:RNA polymerase sigma-70 factor (ECF subfamily)